MVEFGGERRSKAFMLAYFLVSFPLSTLHSTWELPGCSTPLQANKTMAWKQLWSTTCHHTPFPLLNRKKKLSSCRKSVLPVNMDRNAVVLKVSNIMASEIVKLLPCTLMARKLTNSKKKGKPQWCCDCSWYGIRGLMYSRLSKTVLVIDPIRNEADEGQLFCLPTSALSHFDW